MSVPNQASGNEFEIGEIAGIPIRFSPWYLLLVVWVLFRNAGNLPFGMVYLAAFTWSVLLHELGHGLVAKHYGLRPAIVIHAFGGWCERAYIQDRRRNLRIVWAGPAVSLSLAVGFWVLGRLTAGLPLGMLGVFIDIMSYLNLFWGGFNLLPILPMDGGRMLQLQLGYHVNAHRADGISAWVGAVVAAGAAALSWVWFESLLLVLFLGMWAYQNAQVAGAHPLDRTFRPKHPGSPAARGGSGFELPPIVAAAVGLVGGGFVGAQFLKSVAAFQPLVLVPRLALEGQQPWTLLTAPFVYLPGQWEPFLLALGALWFCGRPVRGAYGSDLKFVGLYGGALLLGSLVGLFASGPLGHPDAVLYGAGAGSVALLVAWARFVVPAPVLPGLPLLPWHVVALVLAIDVGAGASGVTDWPWYVHLAGVLPALLIPPRRLAENVVELFPQGGQDTWH